MNSSVTFLGEFSKKLVTNTFFNFVGRTWNFLVTLLLTPFILSHLNVDDFGTWVLLSVFINSFNLLDLGLGSSFVKFISTYHAHSDYDRINQVVHSGLLFYTMFGVLLVGLGLAIEPLFAWFHVPPASDVYLLVLLSCAIQNIAAMLLSVLRGIQRMDKSNWVEIRISIVNIAGTVLFLGAGLGLLGLGINALLNSLVALVLAWWTIRKTVPSVSLGWHFDRGLLREMFAYGTKIQVSRLGGQVYLHVDKLIISRFMGIAAVSFYEVSSRLASLTRSIPLVMISAVIPATSELRARNDRTRILQTYELASKYVSMLTVALVAFVILEARSFITVWVGSGFEQSVVLMQILAIGYGANILGGMASQTGAGIGRPEFDMRSTALLVAVNPVLSLILFQQFGAAGAATGTAVALTMAAVYLLITFHRNYVHDSVWRVLREIHLRPVLSAMLADLAVLGFHKVVPQVPGINEVRYLIPLKIAIDFVLFTPIYIVLLVAFRQVTAIDWKNFLGLVSFGSEFLRHPFRQRVKIYR